MERNSDQIRQEIEATRQQIGQDVQVLADQVNVKKRVHEKVEQLTGTDENPALTKKQQGVNAVKQVHRRYPWLMPAAAVVVVGLASGRLGGPGTRKVVRRVAVTAASAALKSKLK